MSSNQSNLAAFDGESPENACARYEVCGTIVPAGGQMCADCLDAVHAADRGRRDGESR